MFVKSSVSLFPYALLKAFIDVLDDDLDYLYVYLFSPYRKQKNAC